MSFVLSFDGRDHPVAAYVGWSPVPCGIRLSDPSAAPVSVIVRNRRTGAGGQLLFREGASRTWSAQLRLEVPAGGTPVAFEIAGRFGAPSERDKDAAVEAVAIDGSLTPAALPLMVRVRKNANCLSEHERDRFLFAYAALNDAGSGRFREFRQIHDALANDEMHSCPAFLPWHRAFILELERELQAIDPSVTLPYWRFDRPADNVFTEDFMGQEDGSGRAKFSARNPLLGWVSDGRPGVNRKSVRLDPTREPVVGSGPMQMVQTAATFEALPIENHVHARAHRRFRGLLEDAHESVTDPLFFLLHANVDRMWAQWQQDNDKRDPTATGAYVSVITRIGYGLTHTMWPWNEDTAEPRPPFAPGGTFCASPVVSAPGRQPEVRDMFDYQGTLPPFSRLGFDYDDVAFPGIPTT